MKKYFKLILVVAVMVCLLTALSACDTTHVHTLTHHNAVAATCTENGNIEYWSCSDCNKKFSDANATSEITKVVISTAHTGQTEIRNEKAPTEEEEGYTGDTYCLACGQKVSDGTEIAKLDHTHILSKTNAKDATCTVDGNIAYWTCSKCQKHYTDENGTQEVALANTVLDALDHAFGSWSVTKDPSKTETGTLKRTCTRNSSHTETFTLPKLGASGYTLITNTSPSCEGTGTGTYKYMKNGQTFSFDAVLDSLGHNYGNWSVTTEPSKTATGMLTKVCANNAQHTQTFTLPALNKTDYTFEKVSPTLERYSYQKDGQPFIFDVTVPASYTVLFQDWDGRVISTQEDVLEGRDAVLPATPSKNGATFEGWNGSHLNITSNRVITAVYSDAQNRIVLDAVVSGNTVTVTATVKGNVEFYTFEGYLRYNSSVLTYTANVMNISAFAGNFNHYAAGNATFNGYTQSNTNIKTEVVLFTITFTINSGAQGNTCIYLDGLEFCALDADGIDDHAAPFASVAKILSVG